MTCLNSFFSVFHFLFPRHTHTLTRSTIYSLFTCTLSMSHFPFIPFFILWPIRSPFRAAIMSIRAYIYRKWNRTLMHEYINHSCVWISFTFYANNGAFNINHLFWKRSNRLAQDVRMWWEGDRVHWLHFWMGYSLNISSFLFLFRFLYNWISF